MLPYIKTSLVVSIIAHSVISFFLLKWISCLAVLESVSLEKIIPESPQSSEAGDMSPCRSPSTPRHLRYRQSGGTVGPWACLYVIQTPSTLFYPQCQVSNAVPASRFPSRATLVAASMQQKHITKLQTI